MLGLNAGTAYVSIKPDLRGVHTSIRSQLATTNGTFARAGVTAGDNYSRSFGKRFLGGLGTIAKRGGLVLGGALALGGAAAVRSSIQLEQEFGSTMSQIGAATEAPKAQLKSLSDLALKMGADTIFSANEASSAMLELAKGGMRPATIQAGGLKGTLSLAAAGGTDLSTAAMIASDALNVFNLRGSDMEKVAAALAGGANASSASVESLGLAMSQSALSAKNAGLSVQETVATLAAFDNAGLKGSDAGTSLKTMLSRLVPQTEGAQVAMHNLGLDFTHADGSMVSITNVADQLQKKLGPLSDAAREEALSTIFGSDARRAAIALMDEGGKGLARYIRKTSDLGAAQRMADARMRGTSGAIEKMKGSLETAGLTLGIALRPATIAIANLVADIAKRAIPYIQRFGKWLREAMRGDNIFTSISRSVRNLMPEVKKVGEVAPGVMRGLTGTDVSKPTSQLDKMGQGLGKIARAFIDAKRQLPSFTDALKVGGVVFGFLADHAGTVAKLMPWLVAGLVAAKVAQLASNAAIAISVPLRIAEMVANRRLAASNNALVGAITKQTVAVRGSTTAEAVNTGAKNKGVIASARARLATVAKAVAERTAAAASKAFAAGQWLVNAALSANPIGLVIIAITALVAAFIIAWKKSETFRKIVTGVWEGIKHALSAAWSGIKHAVSAGVRFVIDFVKKYWPLLLGILLGPLGLAIGLIIKNWSKIKSAFSAAWDWVKGVFGKLWSGVKAILSQALENARRNLSLIWGKIKAAFSAVWDWVKGTFAQSWQNLKTVLTWPLDKARDGIRAVWENGIKPIFSALGDFVMDKVVPAFRKGVEAVGRAWDWLKSAAVKPVNFVIDTVYNKGIRGFINGILDKFPGDAPKLPYVAPIGKAMSGGRSGGTAPGLNEYARGGVLPGYTPGRDVHTYVSPTAGPLALSGGEAIMRPEWTRLVGGPKVVDKLNRAAMRGRLQYARGGVVWPVPGHDTSTYPGHDGVDINRGSGSEDFGDLIRAFRSGRISYVGSGRGYGDAIFERGPYGEVVYGHTSRQLVRAGQYVRAGQPIGAVGSTGNSSAPHLHFGYPGGTTAQALALLRGATSLPGGEVGGGGGFMGWLVGKATGWLADKAKALLGKVPGADTSMGGIAVGAGQSVVDGIRNWITEHFGGATGGGFGARAVGAAQQYAKSLLARHGWAPSQFGPLQALWNRESGWRWNADNPTSSAYGIPQALPGSKMASAGPDWRTNPMTQIRWGLGYIQSRYGSPAAAWGHSQNVGWYDRGGMLPHGGVAVNRSGRPEPVFTDKQWRLLRQAITRQTIGGGTRITGDFLANMLDRVPKSAERLRDEFVRARDALRGFRTRTESARAALDELRKTDRYFRAHRELAGIESKLDDARSVRAVRDDIDKARRELTRAQRHARGGADLREYRQAARALDRARTEHELGRAEHEQKRRRRQAERDLKRADTETAKHRARVEMDAADKRLKAIETERNERDKLQKRYDRASKAESVADLAKARDRLKSLRTERDRIRELRKQRREAADAKPLQRYERLQDRLNKRIDAEKRARDRATKAAAAYKAAQQTAIERARGIYETGTALGTLESAPSKTSAGIVANLRRSIATVGEWRGIVGRLIRAGLRGPILDEYITAGPSVDAVRLGKSLLAGGQIGDIVRLQEQLRRESVAAGATGARFYKPKPIKGARRAGALPDDARAASVAGRNYQIVYQGMPADTVETIVHKTTQRVRYEIAREATL